MNVDNENQHTSSRSLSVSSTFDTIFAEPMMVRLVAPGLRRMLDSVRCCKFDPFYSSLPKQTAL